VALQLLLNDKYKLESLQGDGSRTRQEIPQTAGCKARACSLQLSHKDIKTLQLNVQNEFDKVDSWMRSNRLLSINYNKTA